MPHIEPLKPKRRQSISPSAMDSSPVITAPDAPRIGQPVSKASLEREQKVKKYYEDLEERYGRSRYTRHRVGEMRVKQPPETPITDVYQTHQEGV